MSHRSHKRRSVRRSSVINNSRIYGTRELEEKNRTSREHIEHIDVIQGENCLWHTT